MCPNSPKAKPQPRYNLAHLQHLVKAGQWTPTTKCLGTANALGFSRTEIEDVVLDLIEADFLSSRLVDNRKGYGGKGLYHDIYKKRSKGIDLWIKLQEESKRGMVIVISFKQFI